MPSESTEVLPMEDNDIKIFTKPEKNDTVNEEELFKEMNTQRVNGNTSKAKKLGKHLSSIFIDEKSLLSSLENEIGSLNYPDQIIYQIKILMFFTAEFLINRKLPNNLLKITAINVLYDSIKDDASQFYKEFSDGVEYSFYYLAIKKENNIDEIGNTFAMVCRKEKDTEFINLGKQIFTVVAHEIEKIIESYNFIK